LDECEINHWVFRSGRPNLLDSLVMLDWLEPVLIQDTALCPEV
jgi:hypothetical protein